MQKEFSYLRDVIGDYIVKLAEENNKIIIVSADMISSCRLKKFEDSFPSRIFNVGIAEQNMVSFAAGLAHEGFIPYVFTMAPFLSMRSCEQIRTDVAYANLKIRMISPYSGCSGGISGPTHWGMEDYAIISSFPNVTIFEPCDLIETKYILDLSVDYEGPLYIRCSVEPSVNVYDDVNDIRGSVPKVLIKGNEGYYICSGITVGYAIEAASLIKEKYNLNIGVIDCFCNKNIDTELIKHCAKTRNIIVAQDHSIIGGLGQTIATIIANNNFNTNFEILGIPNKFEIMGHAQYLYHKFGYDIEGLANNMMKLINRQMV